MNIISAEDFKKQILSYGCIDAGFAYIGEELAEKTCGSRDFKYALSVAVKLSDAVIDGITDSPTHVYFHHYRTVNSHIDNILLKAGMDIEKMGGRYIPVAASQSITAYSGFFQHKTVARLSGLGGIGKSGLFIHKKFGPRVRLGSLLTDLPFETSETFNGDICGDCNICVKLCPAMAIGSKPFDINNPDDTLDRHACSEYMKKHFQHIGRGVVCGICVKNCPKGRK